MPTGLFCCFEIFWLDLWRCPTDHCRNEKEMIQNADSVQFMHEQNEFRKRQKPEEKNQCKADITTKSTKGSVREKVQADSLNWHFGLAKGKTPRWFKCFHVKVFSLVLVSWQQYPRPSTDCIFVLEQHLSVIGPLPSPRLQIHCSPEFVKNQRNHFVEKLAQILYCRPGTIFWFCRLVADTSHFVSVILSTEVCPVQAILSLQLAFTLAKKSELGLLWDKRANCWEECLILTPVACTPRILKTFQEFHFLWHETFDEGNTNARCLFLWKPVGNPFPFQLQSLHWVTKAVAYSGDFKTSPNHSCLWQGTTLYRPVCFISKQITPQTVRLAVKLFLSFSHNYGNRLCANQ